jgi:hypothetical protein
MELTAGPVQRICGWGIKILGCAMREECSEYSLLYYSFQKDILNIRRIWLLSRARSLSLVDNLTIGRVL